MVDEKPVEKSLRPKSNLVVTVPTVMAIGTWLWDMYCQAHGIPYRAPFWVTGIILGAYGGQVYYAARGKVVEALKRLPKKD